MAGGGAVAVAVLADPDLSLRIVLLLMGGLFGGIGVLTAVTSVVRWRRGERLPPALPGDGDAPRPAEWVLAALMISATVALIVAGAVDRGVDGDAELFTAGVVLLLVFLWLTAGLFRRWRRAARMRRR